MFKPSSVFKRPEIADTSDVVRLVLPSIAASLDSVVDFNVSKELLIVLTLAFNSVTLGSKSGLPNKVCTLT